MNAPMAANCLHTSVTPYDRVRCIPPCKFLHFSGLQYDCDTASRIISMASHLIRQIYREHCIDKRMDAQLNAFSFSSKGVMDVQ